MQDESIIWSAVSSGAATLPELETSISLDDLERLLAYKAYEADVREEFKKAKDKNKND